MSHWKKSPRIVALLFSILLVGQAEAQFVDDFDGPSLEDWTFFTGDGAATMDFRPGDGYASILVDATEDTHNIWWALIKRDVSDVLDLSLLNTPGYELRVEVRVQTSHAPRRVNLHLNTQKTVDFHTHLMEYDLPDTSTWHTISMTTKDFYAGPGDTVNAQLALMDWGRGRYRVDLDYFKADVVEVAHAGPDLGEPLPYHPPVPPLTTFVHHIIVTHDAMIDLHLPDLNLNGWHAADASGQTPVLTVGGTQYVLLRWDFAAFDGRTIDGAGLLELTTHSVQRANAKLEEFGQVRVAEILGGDPAWDEETVTLKRWTQKQPLDEVANPQMIIDVEVTETQGGATFATIPRPVMQRLVDGQTLGLLLRPLGPIAATFYATEHADGTHAPRLHFNLTSDE